MSIFKKILLPQLCVIVLFCIALNHLNLESAWNILLTGVSLSLLSVALSHFMARSIIVTLEVAATSIDGIQETGDLDNLANSNSSEINMLVQSFLKMAVRIVQSERSYRSIIDAAPVAMILVNSSGKISYCNRMAQETFTSNNRELKGRQVESLIPERFHSRYAELFSFYFQHLESRYLEVGDELHCQREDGVEFPVEIGLNPVQFDKQDFVLASVIDISRRKKIEQDLVRKTKALENSNHDLHEFAQIASHDLKEPLRGIYNYATFLLEDYENKLDSEGQKKLEILKQLSERMTTIINSLFQYSLIGGQDLVLAETDLDEVLCGTLRTLQVLLNENNVEIRIPRSLPKIHCNKSRITEVFGNLITNAVHYNDKDEKWVEIGFEKKIGEFQFYVSDNGMGIHQEHHERVFQMFKRIHSHSRYPGGTGAGATIVKKIVERHGGCVWIDSTEGKGTTVFFTLQHELPDLADLPVAVDSLKQSSSAANSAR